MERMVAVYEDHDLDNLVCVESLMVFKAEDGGDCVGYGANGYRLRESKSGTLASDCYICLADAN